MKKIVASAVLGLGLLVPVTVVYAQGHMDNHHVWNDGENTYWHQYLKERHIKDHEWDHSTKREQANYWKWRDQHRDNH